MSIIKVLAVIILVFYILYKERKLTLRTSICISKSEFADNTVNDVFFFFKLC